MTVLEGGRMTGVLIEDLLDNFQKATMLVSETVAQSDQEQRCGAVS